MFAAAAPTGLAVTAQTTTSISLAWAAATGATAYAILRQGPGDAAYSVVATPSGTSVTDTGLAPGTSYSYEVRANYSWGTSAASLPVSAPTLVDPTAPSGLTATAVSTSEIDLAWTNNNPNAMGIEIDRSSDGKNWMPLLTALNPTATAYADTGLAPDTAFFYRVSSNPSAGLSQFSTPVEMLTLPAAPAGLTATLNGPREIDLSWQAGSPNDEGLLLERSTDGTNFTAVATAGPDGTSDLLDPSVTSYRDVNVSDGVTYYYRLSLQNPGGKSAPSAVASVNIPILAPSGLAASVPSGSSSEIDLTWTNNSDAPNLIVERSGDGQNFSTVATLSEPVIQYQDSGNPGTRYYYRVRARNSVEISSPSNVADVATAPLLSVFPDQGIDQITIGDQYTLDVVTTFTGTDPVTALSINWGDGQNDTPTNHSGRFTHTYSAIGSYVIRAVAQNPAGPVTATASAIVGNVATTFAVAVSADTIPEGSSITLTPTLFPADAAASYMIDWGDGQTTSGSDGVQHTYPHGTASYLISVAATTSFGVLSATTEVSVTSSETVDYAKARISGSLVENVSGTVEVSVSLPTTVGGGSANDALPPSITVNFGDGSTGNAVQSQSNPQVYLANHKYIEEGLYYATATGGSFTGDGFVDVYEESTSVAFVPIADQVTLPGGEVSVSTTVSGLDPLEPFSAWMDWGDGRGKQPLRATNNGDGTAVISAVLSSAPQGEYTPVITVYDRDGDSSSAQFHLSSQYLLDILRATPQVEQAARAAAEPTGKIIGVNNVDLNGDGIPGFASGFEPSPPTAAEGAGFVPMTITLPYGWDPSTTTLRLSYSGSDPNGVTVTGSGTRADPYLYHPASGTLRVWDQDETASRAETDYLAPDSLINASTLAWDPNGVATVYVEAVAPSQGLGDQTIHVEMISTAGSAEAVTLSDSVKVMAVETNVAVDANRDGTIKLDGSDATTPNNPYQFWLNDGTDAVVWNGTVANYESLVAPGGSNSQSGRIVNQSDLENYAHLEIQVPLTATDGHGKLSPGWTAAIQYVATAGAPSINIVPLDAAYAGTLLTYMNDPTAAAALGGAPSDYLRAAGEWAVGSANSQMEPLSVISGTEVVNPDGSNGYLNYLFDGVTAGSGAVTVRWSYKGTVVAQNSFNLQLQTAAQMYEQVSEITPAMIQGDTANGLGDLRNLPPGQIPSALSDLTITNPYTSSNPQDNSVVVFVHGWRMKLSEMQSYADTAFKRLYWQGYTGRFLAFQWPTEWVDTTYTGLAHPLGSASFAWHQTSSQNFDRSEQKAWNSAPGLYNLLVSLDGTYGSQNVNIFAHSMGNDVVSEALRIAATQANPVPVVNAYIASQAATSADAYDPNVNLGLDIYSDFLGTGSSYFANLGIAAPHMYNFFNPDDFAVGTGVSDRWNLNNSLKPDTGYDHQYTSRFGSTSLSYVRNPGLFGTPGGPLSYANPATRYEAFAYAVHSESGALGGTANVGGPFNWGGIEHQTNLGTSFGFQSDHSGEFDGTEQQRALYWLQVAIDFGLQHW